MNTFFSPQRSHKTRTSFYFDLKNRCVHVFYKKGKEKNVRKEGEYYLTFIEEEREEYIIRLDFIEEDSKITPINFITSHSIRDDLSESSISLLKQYGPEEENNFSIAFPAPCIVSGDIDELELAKSTTLNDFEKLIQTWRGQLSEILNQINNLCVYLSNEYSIINSDQSPKGSPISIRSFKASILNNTILYIENIANFYSSLAVEINASCKGAPSPTVRLTEKELDKLLERGNNFQSLEKKLHFSISKINKLTGSNINLAKDHHWNDIIAIKGKRNSLTHAKIKDYKEHITASLDHMISSVKIADMDLMNCIEVIIWLNKFSDILFDRISVKKDFHNFSFNNYGAIAILKLMSNINQIPYSEALERNQLNDPFNV